MSNPFNDPGVGGDRLQMDDLLGSLLLFDVLEQTGEIQTINGPATAIRCNVAVLDGPHKGEVHTDGLVFQRKLQMQLRSSVGARVLGRLELGAKQPGKNAPFQLAVATDADRETGRRYLAYMAAQTVTVPDDEEPF